MVNELLAALAQARGNPNLQDIQAIPNTEELQAALMDAAAGLPSNLVGAPMDMAYMMTMRPEEMASMITGVQTRPELREFPMSSDWIGERLGADIDSPAFLLSGLISPDGTDVAIPAMKAAMLMGVPKAARMTRAEAEAAGLWHDIGIGKKLPKPVGAVEREIGLAEDIKPQTTINPEELLGGRIIPAYGDRSDAGFTLTGVDGVQFEDPILVEGGHGFMRRSPDSIWASAKSQISGLNNKVVNAIEDGRDPYLVFAPMGHGSMNHNVMMADVMLEMMKGSKITKKAKSSFDKQVRSLRPDWAGIDSPKSLEQIESNGEVRKAFMQVAALDEFQGAGFPNPTIARIALTDPNLMDLPIGMGGQSVGKATGQILEDPKLPHKTYSHQMGGEYVGGFEQPIPRDVMYPDWYKSRRVDGRPISSDSRSFELSKPTQDANQEWLDGVMNYLLGIKG